MKRSNYFIDIKKKPKDNIKIIALFFIPFIISLFICILSLFFRINKFDYLFISYFTEPNYFIISGLFIFPLLMGICIILHQIKGNIFAKSLLWIFSFVMLISILIGTFI
ncbi:MAG: hypothetical protein K4H23_02330 [Mollicutes bacterium PWAP]|nr:hypothetical protein [Mollicutes bacterium PWAP]